MFCSVEPRPCSSIVGPRGGCIYFRVSATRGALSLSIPLKASRSVLSSAYNYPHMQPVPLQSIYVCSERRSSCGPRMRKSVRFASSKEDLSTLENDLRAFPALTGRFRALLTLTNVNYQRIHLQSTMAAGLLGPYEHSSSHLGLDCDRRIFTRGRLLHSRDSSALASLQSLHKNPGHIPNQSLAVQCPCDLLSRPCLRHVRVPLVGYHCHI